MENIDLILRQLQTQQKALISQLKSIRHAIVGFGGELSNKDLQELLNVEGETPLERLLIVPLAFSGDLPRTQKIAFALKQLGGEGFVSEIVEKLRELEPDLTVDEAKLKRNTTLLTSYLYRDGRLAVKKDAKNRYRYRLIE